MGIIGSSTKVRCFMTINADAMSQTMSEIIIHIFFVLSAQLPVLSWSQRILDSIRNNQPSDFINMSGLSSYAGSSVSGFLGCKDCVPE